VSEVQLLAAADTASCTSDTEGYTSDT